MISLLPAILLVAQEQNCRYGFNYEISNEPHWGKGKPVITGVHPNSPAERAGVKPFDIIIAVDGVAITDNVLDEIHLFLNPENKEIVEFTIKNFSSKAKKIQIKKECRNIYSISEEQLATAFAMYAVEFNQERLFSCPFITTLCKDSVDFSSFKSFNFFGGSENQPAAAQKIIDLIKKELTDRGLKFTPVDPDLIVQIYYSFNKNSNYKPKQQKKSSRDKDKSENEGLSYVYRFDVTRDRIFKFPFLPPNTLENEAQYILKLGFRIEDNTKAKGRVLWECEANELMNEPFSLNDFASVHIPLMCMQFPYTKYGRNVQFRLSKKKYNYTGLNYNIDKISQIASVDQYSPAAKAGIMPFDIIDEIGDKRMDRTSKQFTSAYREFLVNTLSLRNQETRFVDANGFPDCMYWNEAEYPKVINEFNNKKNLTLFSYLFSYATFINPSGNTTCTIKLRRDKEKLQYIIRPEVRSATLLVVE
jgi:hypothetical protein